MATGGLYSDRSMKSNRVAMNCHTARCRSMCAIDCVPTPMSVTPPPPGRQHRGFANRPITKDEIINTPEKETPRNKCKKVSNEETKKTSRVMIYEYHAGDIGTANPEDTQYPSACKKPSICDTLMDSAIPPQTQGACKWCKKTFSATTSEGFFKKIEQHLGTNKRCLKQREGHPTATPQEAIEPSDDVANILRLNRAKYNARDSLIGSEFDPEFLDAWDRKLRDAHSADSTDDGIKQLVEVIRRLRAMGYLRESPHPPGMRRPPSYVVPTRWWPLPKVAAITKGAR